MNTSTNNKNLIERLFSVGAHFGFTKSRRHPTVKPYIFGTKNGTDIFDLEKTASLLDAAKTALREAGANGKVLVLVGTKDEASKIVREAAQASQLPYVVDRWIGGMLTNWGEIKKRIARLHELTREAEAGELERKYTKKERVLISREMDKLAFNFGGIRDIERIPDIMLVVDPRHDTIPVDEARVVGIPVVAIMSSDNDIARANYPVVVNDSLRASISLVLEELVAAYNEGKATYTPRPTRGAARIQAYR